MADEGGAQDTNLPRPLVLLAHQVSYIVTPLDEHEDDADDADDADCIVHCRRGISIGVLLSGVLWASLVALLAS